jgi:hypothetical protein
MKNINTLLELIQDNYPISKEAEIVFEQSFRSYFNQVSSNLDVQSQDPTLLPVFCAKFLHFLEKEGVKVIAYDKPAETLTYRSSEIDFAGYLEVIGIDIESMLISKLVEISIMELQHNSTIKLYSVIPYIDHKEKKAYVYLRGLGFSQKVAENVVS